MSDSIRLSIQNRTLQYQKNIFLPNDSSLSFHLISEYCLLFIPAGFIYSSIMFFFNLFKEIGKNEMMKR